MKTRTFNLSLPAELVRQLDIRAEKEYTTRSGYIRQALIDHMRAEGVFGESPANQAQTKIKRAHLKEFLGTLAKTGYKEDVR